MVRGPPVPAKLDLPFATLIACRAMRIPAARPLSLLLLLLVAPACLLPRAGAAAQVTGLYEGRVPVSGEDEATSGLARRSPR